MVVVTVVVSCRLRVAGSGGGGGKPHLYCVFCCQQALVIRSEQGNRKFGTFQWESIAAAAGCVVCTVGRSRCQSATVLRKKKKKKEKKSLGSKVSNSDC